MAQGTTLTADEVLGRLETFLTRSVERLGTTDVNPPGHRVPFHWPPHAASVDYCVPADAWTSRESLRAFGEELDVDVAVTDAGVFGRSRKLWNEARGETTAEMLDALREGCVPYFERMDAITGTLMAADRFHGSVRDLGPVEWVCLLFCPDRDVANEAKIEIETHASSGLFGPALVQILRDDRHPDRRVAQWCVLDMFEDLPAFCPTEVCQSQATAAIRDFLFDAPDDYARCAYKAGVVLGGHICTEEAGRALMDCLEASSKYGRRSAAHAVFHLVEWCPSTRDEVVRRLRVMASQDDEPLLRTFASYMADDIANYATDHVLEPVFPEED
ncbi:MAG: hypothetical protein KF857_10460 [Fimbriimonadaceae bacterium]|nr:hypothetical protein [Fimbriimonadaceae bacterium]